ncbi:dihydrofolate reductase [Nakamurella sp. YIM 132087]|uniref:Dihydrofolate reductase n=1 Tax=Nakamurella alba TaxID=2665158 RepID=A0A7K1FR34_9ACTN|nr:dihydrofolate reductase family protein [Nakamurella alba]MTD16596.1 dihydrofolate reductase [Nakamurella alba]
MGTVIASGSMSLDGYVALDDNTVGPLFDWYEAGTVEWANHGDVPPFHLTTESAKYLEWTRHVGAVVAGRNTFDFTDGWNGTHPFGCPVVIATHEAPTGWDHPGSENFSFVTDGIEAVIARAREVAGNKDIAVTAGEVATQAVRAGLIDEIRVDLVPVLLGRGRPFFTTDPSNALLLQDPIEAITAKRVVHLRFAIQR